MSLIYSQDTTVTSGTQSGAVSIPEPINIFRFEVNFRFSGHIKGTHIIDLRNGNNTTNTGYQPLYIDDTKLQFHIAPSYSFDWDYNFKPNIDYHIEITISNKSITAFVNGNRLINSSSFPTSWGTLPYGTFNLSIGKRFEPSNGNYNDVSGISGTIWGLKIYNHAEALIITSNNICTKAFEETTLENTTIDPCVLKANNFIENEYLYLPSNEAKYLKIFDHNVSKDPTSEDSYFTNESEAKYCFLPNKFSRLGDLGSPLFKSISNNLKYEFLLRYPGAWHRYDAGQNNNTGIIIDWTKSFSIDLDIELLNESMGTRRLIIGNYQEDTINNFSLELNDGNNGKIANTLRLYVDNEDIIDSSETLHAGIWHIAINWDVEKISLQVIATSTSGEYISISSGELGFTMAPSTTDPLVIGALDYRTVSIYGNPFNAIKARLTPTNIWKQSGSPLNNYANIDGDIAGYEDVSIQMNGRWGFDGEALTGKGLGLYTVQTLEPDCLLDTQPGHDYWWGGLGQYKPYTEHGITGFPSADGTIEQHVQLWVRIDNTNYDAYIAITKNGIYCNEFREE